jgi:hypothetical protein
MKPTVSLRRALADPQLLGQALPGESWKPWRTLLIGAMGEPLHDAERELFQQLTHRAQPTQRASTLAIVCGRRGGKSRATATLAAYLAGLVDHSDVLVRGETGVLLVVAADLKQSKIVRDYIAAAFESSPILAQLVGRQSSDMLELTNGISVECRPASYRKLRGATYVGAVCDELCFWYSDDTYVNVDAEVLGALKPGLVTTRGPLIMASSAYARAGALYETWKEYFGQDNGDTLVAYGTSRDFNPSLSQAEIDRALAEDRARNEAEYLSKWRSDIERFISLQVVEGCVGDFCEILPARDTSYRCFVDPASGSGEDSFTLSVAHKQNDQIIIDCVREIRPPFSPTAAVEYLVHTVKSYRCRQVMGDHYAGEFPRELFKKHGIDYEVCKTPKSDLFRDLLPLLNSGAIALPRNDRLVAQIVALERRVTRAGKDSITHPDRGHDDVANCVAGVAASLVIGEGYYNIDSLAGDMIPGVGTSFYGSLMAHIMRNS